MRPVRTIAVCEPAPFWKPELQRQLSGEDVAVQGCPAPEDVSGPACVCVIVLNGGAADASHLDLLRRLGDRQPATGIVVIVPERWNTVVWPLWDLGATTILESTCGGGRLAEVCRRLLQTASSVTSHLTPSRACCE